MKKKLLFITFLMLFCSTMFGQTIERKYTPANTGQYQDGFTLTTKVSFDGGAVVQQAGLELGVFCGDECRASGMSFDNGLIMVGVLGQDGEFFTFKLYDHNTGIEWIDNTIFYNGNPYPALPFIVDYEYGDLTNPCKIDFKASDNNFYTFDENQYEYDMQVTAIVQIDGVEQTSSELEIGAFCGQDIRGSQKTMYVEGGRYYARMSVYGSNDDNITFKLYDHATKAELVFNDVNTLVFQKDETIGSLADPFEVNFITAPYVAQINDVKYISLAAAFEAATEGQTVTMLTNITEEFDINNTANVTFDMATYTLTGAIKPSTANLTIKNGTIVNENSSVSAIEINAGSLTLNEDVTIESARHAVRIDGNVTATINGGNYKVNAYDSGKTQHAVNVSGTATVTILGGTFVGPKGTSADSGAAVNVQSGATVSISGGSFSGGKNNTLASKGTLTLTGGNYDQDVASFCAEGYISDNNGNGTWTVRKANYVAQIGTVKYESLAEAFEAATEGQTVTMLTDITEDFDINNTANVIFDMATYTLTGAITPSNAKLTIKNGTIVNEKPSVSAIEINAGSLTLNEDVTIESARHAVRIDGNVTATINGGNYKVKDYDSGKTQHAVNVSGTATVTILGGTFVGPKGTSADSGAAVNVQSGATVSISGGSFSGGKNNTLASKGTLTLTGGTYDQDVTSFCAEGYISDNNGNGTWTVRQANYVAQIGTVKYESLDEAFAAATEGQTVTMLTNITEDFDINNTANVTFDMATYTLTGAITPSTANLTIKNGTIVNKNSSVSAIEINAGSLTLNEDVTIESARHAVRIDGNVTATINGGNYKVKAYDSGKTQHAVNVSGTATVTIVGGTFVGPKGTSADSGAAVNVQSGATVSISGGSFSGGKNNTLASKGTLTLTGGTYDQDVASFCAEGYISDNNGNGTWTVRQANYVAQIGTVKYESLDEAFAAAQDGNEVKILKAGTYALNTSGKNITITGAVDGVVFDNIGAKNMGGANVTFNNVTFDYYPNVNYTGLQHSGNLVYNNCTINGQVFLYGTSETFSKCTFNQNSADAYNVWTYGAKEVAFNECTFNSVGKSVLIYNESESVTNDVTVTDCDFIATAPVDGKAAIEMDSSLQGEIELTVDAATTVTGFGTGNVSGNSLWNNKKGNETEANNDITVVVNGATVLAPLPLVAMTADDKDHRFTSLQAAYDAVAADGTITILNSVEGPGLVINKNVTIDFAGYTYTFNKACMTNSPYGFYLFNMSGSKNVILKNGTLTSTAVTSGMEVEILVMNHANLTLTDMNLVDNTAHIQYVLSNNSGISYINGATNITSDAKAFDVYDYSALNFELPIVNVNTTGKITGAIEVSESISNNLNISGGTFTVEIEEAWCAEGYIPTQNTDGTWTVKAGKYVARIGEIGYETLAEAIAAIGAGDVVIELLDNASLDITAWQTLAIGGDNTTSITIDGDNGEEEDFTLTFNKLNSDWNHVATSNDNATKLILKNLKLADSGYNNGPWNRYDIVFASDVELTNVVSAKALAFKADATLNNVTINESGDNYAIWIQPNGQSVTIDGLVINSAGRGIKVDEQYVTAQNVSLSVANATFETAKKAAIMVKSSAETTITVGENVNIDKVAADQTNIAWVDEDAAAHYGKVTVTGGTLTQENLPVFVAALMNNAKVEGYYKVFEEALAAAEDEKILVLKTVVFDTDKTIDFGGKEVNSNVNPAFRITNGATVTVKNGNMNTAEGYNFILGASDSSSAGNLTIESGTFHGATTVASVTKGLLTITGGEFSVEPYQGNYAFLINCIDANYGNGSATVSISGGTFHNWNPENNAAEGAGTNFCADGYVAVYDAEHETYTVIQANYVAQIGEVKYESLQAAINAAVDNDEIDVIDNITLGIDDADQLCDNQYKSFFNVDGKTITIDLNGYTIKAVLGGDLAANAVSALVSTENESNLTIKDSSDEKTGTMWIDNVIEVYSLVFQYDNSIVTIESGNYKLNVGGNGRGMVYSNDDEKVTVNGGNFWLGNVGTLSNGSPWIFNASGQNTRNIIVNGGTFNDDVLHQFYPFEVMNSKEKALQNNGDGTWTMVDAVAYVDEQHKSGQYYTNYVGFATLEEAFAAAQTYNQDGNYVTTVTMLTNVTAIAPIVVVDDVKFNMNTKAVTAQNIYPVIRIQNGASLTVTGAGSITNNDYVFVLGASDSSSAGNLTIENGTFHGATTVASVTKGNLNITGGDFSVEPYNNNYAFLINCIDANYNNGDAKVSISGGTFHNWNPENNAAEGAGTNFCAYGYGAIENTPNVWTVIPKQTMTAEVKKGWNWFSYYVEGNVLNQLQNSLGAAGVQIKSRTAFTQYSNDGSWNGDLVSTTPAESYKINVNADAVINVTGNIVNPSECPIMLNNGGTGNGAWNWIGYPLAQETSVATAFAGVVKNGDEVKTRTGFAEYVNGQWWGSLMTLKPGVGYMYFRAGANETVSNFTYPTPSSKEAVQPNITADANLWVPNSTSYANNMTMVAVLNMNGEMMNDNYEVAAMVNGEVRGSARPIYVEPMDAYMLFLTIHGEGVEEVTFQCYDFNTDTEYVLNNTINYSDDARLGSVNEPYVLCYGTMGIGENTIDNINIYPNPTTTDREINLQATCDKVEVFNALGVKVAEYHNVDTLDAIETAGIYVIRVTNDGDVKHCRLVVK